MTGEPILSVVIPAYNEERRLPKTLATVGDYLSGTGRRYEIVVVDDGSADGTPEVARKASFGMPVVLLSQIPNRGKGAAVRRGLAEARGDRILITDADLSTPITELPALEAALQGGAADMAIGSRGLPESNVTVRQSWYRQGAGRLFNVMIRFALAGGFRDTQCGFKLLTRRCVDAVLPRLTINGFAFDVEMVLVARHLGLAVAEVPITWVNSPESKVRFLHDSMGMMRDLLRIRMRAWNGFPAPQQPRR